MCLAIEGVRQTVDAPQTGGRDEAALHLYQAAAADEGVVERQQSNAVAVIGRISDQPGLGRDERGRPTAAAILGPDKDRDPVVLKVDVRRGNAAVQLVEQGAVKVGVRQLGGNAVVLEGPAHADR